MAKNKINTYMDEKWDMEPTEKKFCFREMALKTFDEADEKTLHFRSELKKHGVRVAFRSDGISREQALEVLSTPEMQQLMGERG